jgi:hypothetical protein
MILSLGARTGEEEIYSKMNVMKLEEIYKYRLLMFLFKHKYLFQLHNTEQITRKGGGISSVYPSWTKTHSRWQARYRGSELFSSLPYKVRGEKRLSSYKNEIRRLLASKLIN